MGERMRRARDEAGSILPLLLGFVALALALIGVCTCATDLHLSQKRLDVLADAAALAGADGFLIEREGEQVHAVLSDAGVREQAEAIIASRADTVTLTEAVAADGRSARITLTTVWRPPFLSPFVPDGVPLTATATSRTALE